MRSLALTLLLATARAVAAQPDVAVTHVTVVDVAHGVPLRDRTVLVRDGRIARVGPAATTAAPAGAEVVDGRGRWLVPGFADMHVHVGDPAGLRSFVVNGVTTVRNMSGDTAVLRLRRDVDDGRLVGPRIVTAGPVVESDTSTYPGDVMLPDAASARAEVLRQRAAGYDFIKVYNHLRPEIYDSLAAAARDAGMPIAGHVPLEVGLLGALARGQRSVEHLRGWAKELVPADAPVVPGASFVSRSVAWRYADTGRIAPLVRRTVAAGAWNVPTFAFELHELVPAADFARLRARPETRYLALVGMPDRAQGYHRQFTEADYRDTQRGLVAQFAVVRALDRAGAGLLVGTDSWLEGFAYDDELDALARAGLSPARVLRMATLDAARYLGEAGRWGEVKPGRRADLVLLGADPLASTQAARRVEAVILAGRLFRRADLDRLLVPLR